MPDALTQIREALANAYHDLTVPQQHRRYETITDVRDAHLRALEIERTVRAVAADARRLDSGDYAVQASLMVALAGLCGLTTDAQEQAR